MEPRDIPRDAKDASREDTANRESRSYRSTRDDLPRDTRERPSAFLPTRDGDGRSTRSLETGTHDHVSVSTRPDDNASAKGRPPGRSDSDPHSADLRETRLLHKRDSSSTYREHREQDSKRPRLDLQYSDSVAVPPQHHYQQQNVVEPSPAYHPVDPYRDHHVQVSQFPGQGVIYSEIDRFENVWHGHLSLKSVTLGIALPCTLLVLYSVTLFYCVMYVVIVHGTLIKIDVRMFVYFWIGFFLIFINLIFLY